MISAVAAAITLAVLLPQRTAVFPGPVGAHPQVSGSPGIAPTAHPGTDWLAAVEGPRRRTDSIDRDVIGVFDQQSGSLYLLEFDGTRSSVEPVRANY